MHSLERIPHRSRLATGLLTTIGTLAFATGCDYSHEDPINRAEITALQQQAKDSLPLDCSYVYQFTDTGFALNSIQLAKKDLTEAAQEVTAQNNDLIVPKKLRGGEQTSLTKLQKDVIAISSQATARTMMPPYGPAYYEIVICPSEKVLDSQLAYVVAHSPLIAAATRS